jgi:hypothetical protein
MNAELPFLHSWHQALPDTWDSKGCQEACRNRDDLKGLCSVSGRLERPGTLRAGNTPGNVILHSRDRGSGTAA